ncbi:DUF485 domain-containing protein [Williamsia muralis]|uniref:DUF485 domain-containing protein n=1 Tax=Williamsia marianensis TaxID=85044 RepID=UPI00381F1DD2
MSSSDESSDSISDEKLDAMWADDGMRHLLAQRKSFFKRAWTIFVIAWALFILWPVFFPSSYGHILVSGLSVGLVVCAIYVVVCFALTLWYSKSADRWDGLASMLIRGLARPTPDKTGGSNHG